MREILTVGVSRFIYKYKDLKRDLVFIYIFNFINLLIALLLAALEKDFVNNLLGSQSFSALWKIISSFLAGAAGTYILSKLIVSRTSKIQLKWAWQIKQRMIDKLLATPIEVSKELDTDDMKMRIDTDADIVVQLYLDLFTVAIPALISLILYILLALYFGSWLSLLVLFGILIFEFLGLTISRVLDKKSLVIRQKTNQANQKIYAALNNYKAIKIKSNQSAAYADFVAGQEEVQEANFSWMFSYVEVILFQLIKTNFIQKVFIYLISAFSVINGLFSIGTIVLLLNYFNNFSNYVAIISKLMIDINGNKNNYERCKEILEKNYFSEVIKDISCLQNISIKDLTFSYPQEKEILNKVNLTIEKGDKLLLLGASGQGKSTLIKCIARLEKPNSGFITINGVSAEKINNYFSLFSIVQQASVLFDISLIENLILGNKDITMKEVEEACEKVGLKQDIIQGKLKWETEIGVDGSKLSGGQRQKVLIARAILKDSQVLIFDESTSALDSQSEEKINRYLLEEESRAILMISHRETTQRRFEKKYLLAGGELRKV